MRTGDGALRRWWFRARTLLRRCAGRPGSRGAQDQKDELGRAGERAAAKMLRRAGFRVLARNVRVRRGEADLVCLDPDRRTIVVVEVKTRRRDAGVSERARAVPPEAGVHARKRRTLLAVTRSLARANGWVDRPVRIDVVAVDWLDGRPNVRHFVNAVRSG